MDEIVLAATYSEIDLRVCQNLKDYLNGVVQNKLNHCQQLITKKQKQPQDNSVVQTFEHKIANVLKNTVHPNQQGSQTPIYNMRETIDQICIMYPDIEVIATQTCVASTDTQVE
ncbi:hypothetical protein P1I32_019005 [Acinetobacter baumannii]|nr:hypothetical protein [Acinetobacter baumannii]MDF9679802.1 hypothetical protein [Acinetobacter baumannii]MDF9687168.1 hypothetical protein [Acinetobacter baumannii]MDF9694488.1 hypothetical protein [Acinetobacter baumannii]MDF9704759.1 hypothetical protein [Acinetobacter baumannii]